MMTPKSTAFEAIVSTIEEDCLDAAIRFKSLNDRLHEVIADSFGRNEEEKRHAYGYGINAESIDPSETGITRITYEVRYNYPGNISLAELEIRNNGSPETQEVIRFTPSGELVELFTSETVTEPGEQMCRHLEDMLGDFEKETKYRFDCSFSG